MITTKNILPVTSVKRDLMKHLKRVQETGDPLVITKNGQAAGVLLSSEEYESLMETLGILSDKDLMRSLKKAERDFRARRTHTHHQVFKE